MMLGFGTMSNNGDLGGDTNSREDEVCCVFAVPLVIVTTSSTRLLKTSSRNNDTGMVALKGRHEASELDIGTLNV